MKIQYLAVIFIIIVLPISLILSAYTQNQVKTLTLQISYDGKLLDSTYDAVKAFQLNTIHNTSSDLSGSKVKELEASANTFFTSIANNFNMVGYNSEALQEYIPALVYTLYDGFYIYSSFNNAIGDVETKTGSAYENGQKENGLLPYVYYSCEYKNYLQTDDDFVITYSLDNYIRIQGKVNGKYINEAGYYITGITKINEDKYKYNDCCFDKDEAFLNKENVGIDTNNGTTDMKEYIKVNGKKYYKKDGKWIYYDYSNENEQTTFTNTGLNRDNSAYLFYKEAYEFTKKILGNYNLKELTATAAVNKDNYTKSYKIFDDLEDSASLNSDFNQHKLEVIKYTIERNLAAAIANFNSYSEAGTDFQMPKLSDVDWEKILGKVSVISFLQGLNIGGKIYNGYAIVGNNKTDEFVADDSIYIVNNNNNNNYYYRVTDSSINENSNATYTGFFNTDFERKKRSCNGSTIWFYQRPEYGSYTSIVNNFTTSDEDVYTYVKNLEVSNANIKKAYFTALARERYSMYKTDRDVAKVFKDLGLTQ